MRMCSSLAVVRVTAARDSPLRLVCERCRRSGRHHDHGHATPAKIADGRLRTETAGKGALASPDDLVEARRAPIRVPRLSESALGRDRTARSWGACEWPNRPAARGDCRRRHHGREALVASDEGIVGRRVQLPPEIGGGL